MGKIAIIDMVKPLEAQSNDTWPGKCYFTFTNDGKRLMENIPIMDIPGIYSVRCIMTEEIFKECYERWILGKEPNKDEG